MNNVKSWAQMQEDARQAALRSQLQAQQLNQGRMGGGQMYAGGDPNFDERTGQPVQRPAYDYMGQNGAPGHFNPKPYGIADSFPKPRNGDGFLAMLLKKYGGAAQGAGGEIGDWFKNRLPSANRQYNLNNQARINRGINRSGG